MKWFETMTQYRRTTYLQERQCQALRQQSRLLVEEKTAALQKCSEQEESLIELRHTLGDVDRQRRDAEQANVSLSIGILYSDYCSLRAIAQTTDRRRRPRLARRWTERTCHGSRSLNSVRYYTRRRS